MVDRHALTPDLAVGALVVRVEAHQRWHVEVDRDAGLSVRDQIAQTGVRVLGPPVAGDLAHRPRSGPVHRRVRATQERILAGEAGAPFVTLDVLRREDPLERLARGRLEAFPALRDAIEEREDHLALPAFALGPPRALAPHLGRDVRRSDQYASRRNADFVRLADRDVVTEQTRPGFEALTVEAGLEPAHLRRDPLPARAGDRFPRLRRG